MKKLFIITFILFLTSCGYTPIHNKSNIQNLARQNRYNLLFKECNKHNIKNIFTAHHQDDVYETFFIRLIRGSGTEGLSSFSEIKKNLRSLVKKEEIDNLKRDDEGYIDDNLFIYHQIREEE